MVIRKFASLALAAVLAVTVMAGCGKSSDDPNSIKPGHPDAEGYTEGLLGDTMHTEFFDFTVNSAYTCASYEGYTPNEGWQIVVVELMIQNTSSGSISMFDVEFPIQWNDDADDAYKYPVTYYLETGKTLGQNMFPNKYELSAKESRTGILAYEVPEGESQFSIDYQTMFDDGSYGGLYFVFFSANEK